MDGLGLDLMTGCDLVTGDFGLIISDCGLVIGD